MNLLGFDTSTAATSACVLRDDGEAFELRPAPAALFRGPAHGAELLPALDAVLERAGLGYADLDALAVGVGPGMFTGLRIGVASARALAQARSLGLRPVSSLAALAAGIEAPLRLALIDARRGQLFAALHEGSAERWAPFAVEPEALAERVHAEGLAPLAAGDGSIRFRGVLESAGIGVEPDEAAAHVVSALELCRLAAAVEPLPPQSVLPEYLREPDARPRSE